MKEKGAKGCWGRVKSGVDQITGWAADSIYTFTGILTVAYLAFVVYVYSMSTKAAAFNDLPPNEIGDFLAGIFAPITFAWLIASNIKTQRITRVSIEAQTKQEEKLEQQFNLMQDQFDLERQKAEEERNRIKLAAMPNLVFTKESASKLQVATVIYDATYLKNKGQTAKNVSISSKPEYLDPQFIPALNPNESFEVTWSHQPPSGEHFTIEIQFSDIYNNHYTRYRTATIDASGLTVMISVE